jgi:hypothetical protein
MRRSNLTNVSLRRLLREIGEDRLSWTMIQRACATVAAMSAAVAAAACATPAAPPMSTGDGGLADTGGAGGCPPQSITPPAITWIPPHALHSNACSQSDAAVILSCVLDGQNCTALVTVTCRACMISGDTTPSSATVIVHESPGSAPELNIAGCVGAASGDPSAGGCGAKLAAKTACIASACAGCTAPTDFQSCSAQASTSVCAAANADAQCAAPYMALCVHGATEGEIALNLANVFCGP